MAKAAGSIWIEGTQFHFVSSSGEEYYHTGEVVSGIITKAYQQVILEDNPSHYWRLDETSGLTAVDLVGGKNGTISGGVTLNQAGKHDKAMLFDGTGKIVVPHGTFIDDFGTKSFSWEVWCKLNTFPPTSPNRFRYLIDVTDSNYYGETLYLNPAGSIEFMIYGITEDFAYITTPPILLATYYQIVVVINRTIEKLQVYLNGVLSVETDTIAGADYTGSPDKNLAIGYMDIPPYSTDIGWDGIIDEVAIYPYALSPAQITKHFNPQSGNAAGSIWIEGDYLHYVDAANQERRIANALVAAQAGIAGSLWAELSRLHWINEAGNSHRLGHNDITHDDVHSDSIHSDAIHTDIHTDVVHTDAHGDGSHADTPHQDSHTDTHSDTHNNEAHSDHTDSRPHTNTHGDSPHTDQAHLDYPGGHGDHQDVGHGDSGAPHGDTPFGDHTDSSHGDISHIDKPHIDESHEDSHSDSHSDVAHKDIAHQNTGHTDTHSDIIHQDVPHQDQAHGDEPHQNTHTDIPHNDQPVYVGP